MNNKKFIKTIVESLPIPGTTSSVIIEYPLQSGLLMSIVGLTFSIISFVKNDTDNLQLGLIIIFMGGFLAVVGSRVFETIEEQTNQTEGTYAERLNSLTARLNAASTEVDSILHQMQSEAEEQEAIVSSLEDKLGELTSRKSQLETTIEQLEQIKNAAPLVEELTRNVEIRLDRDAKRSGRREIFMFLFGFIIGLPVSIISDIVANLLTQG